MKLFTAAYLSMIMLMNQLHLIISEGLVSQQLHDMVVSPSIIAQCIQQLKKGKGDGNYGFTPDHLIYGGHRLYVLLSIILFNVMLQHGYNAKD